MQSLEPPVMAAKLKKKLKKLTLTYKEYELVLTIDDNSQIDLIAWDEWFTNVLQKEAEKVALRRKLGGAREIIT